MKRVAIYASGAGSNADKIAEYFSKHASVSIGLIVTNKAEAGVIEVAKRHNIPHEVISKATLNDQKKMEAILNRYGIDFIVLAGFLLLVPRYLTEVFSQRIINIHPALLPSYGGKGMYGMHVHQAVVDAGEKESGITIHYVNEHFDEGEIIRQEKCTVEEGDTPENVAQKIHQLEYKYFAPTIEQLLS